MVLDGMLCDGQTLVFLSAFWWLRYLHSEQVHRLDPELSVAQFSFKTFVKQGGIKYRENREVEEELFLFCIILLDDVKVHGIPMLASKILIGWRR
jgi:hypothetical protein